MCTTTLNNQKLHLCCGRMSAVGPLFASKALKTSNFALGTPLQHRSRSLKNVSRHDEAVVSESRTSSALLASSSSSSSLSTSPVLPSPPTLPVNFPPEYYDSQGRLVLKNLGLDQIREWLASIDEPNPQARAAQIWRFMLHDNYGYREDWSDCRAPAVQDGFSAAFIAKIAPLATMSGGLVLESVHTAGDGTRKLQLRVTEGAAKGSQLETVLIPIVREGGSKHRITICVSSQVGCRMNCQFCYTGRMGLGANLTAAQIVEQVVAARRVLAAQGGGLAARSATNIVFMGMGEPLDNVGQVLQSIRVANEASGLHFGRNKITLSTVGLLPALNDFLDANTNGARLAVSLHATTDEVRDWIVPQNKRTPLAALLASLAERFPKGGRDHVLIAYTMLHGVNDTPDDAARLVSLLSPIECKVNLIVFNPFQGTIFKPSTPEAVAAFRSTLIQVGMVCTVRESRGGDEMAACGQLGSVAGLDLPSGLGLPRMLQPPERFRAQLELGAGGGVGAGAAAAGPGTLTD